MAAEWYYSQGGEQNGPVSANELKELAISGTLSPSDLVWKEGMDKWTSASTVKELFQATGASNPTRSPMAPPPLSPSIQSIDDQGEHHLSLQATSPSRTAWAEWNLGGRVIFVSACVAIVSMLMKWVDIGIASANGFSQGTFLLLGVFIYPSWKLLKRKPINLYAGIGSAATGALFAMIYMSEKVISFGDRTAFLFGPGAVFFFLACVGLGYGIFRYDSSR